MQEQSQPRKSALRNVWGIAFMAAALIWAGNYPQEFGSDIVSDAFGRFFTTFGIFPGLAILVGLIYTVARRVDRGDPFKEDLSLMLSALGVILSALGVILSIVK